MKGQNEWYAMESGSYKGDYPASSIVCVMYIAWLKRIGSTEALDLAKKVLSFPQY